MVVLNSDQNIPDLGSESVMLVTFLVTNPLSGGVEAFFDLQFQENSELGRIPKTSRVGVSSVEV